MNTAHSLTGENIHDSIGPKIKDHRIGRGMTQDELAGAAGVKQSLISRIENGTANPSLRTLTRIAESLGVEVGELTKGGGGDGQGGV